MAQLIVRNLEDEVVRRLKEQAGRHGHSAEEEHRRILRAALLRGATTDFKNMLSDFPDVIDDRDLERIRDLPRPVAL